MSNSDSASESSLNFAVLIAVVLAGVAGTVVNAVAAAIVISPAAIRLALVPGRYVIAILVAGTLPLIFFDGTATDQFGARPDRVDCRSIHTGQDGFFCARTMVDRAVAQRRLRSGGAGCLRNHGKHYAAILTTLLDFRDGGAVHLIA